MTQVVILGFNPTTMKFYITLIIAFLLHFILQSQTPFVLNIEQEEVDGIKDAIEIEGKYYFLQTRAFNFKPNFIRESYSDLIITTEKGELLEIVNLGGLNSYYHRIVKADTATILLIGQTKNDTCLSKFIISEYNILSKNLTLLGSLNLCDKTIQNIKITKGLDGRVFIDEYHSYQSFLSKSIYEIDSNYQISPILDSLIYSNAFSVDFSRKGYLINADRLKRFYDSNFNFIKQKWFDEEVDCENEAQIPFSDNLLLIQTIQDRSDKPDFGFQVLLIDSLLNVRKKAVITPQINPGFMFTPFYGGLQVRNENEIWVLYHAHQEPDITKSFFVISKLDSNLHVQCQHFIGYDSWYRTYGLRLIDKGGVIVYGTRMRDGMAFNQGEDVYAMVIGQDCQIPLTSLARDRHKIYSLTVYPNPGINEISFLTQGFDAGLLSLELVDVQGIVRYTHPSIAQPVLLPDLAAGQYFYRILRGDELLATGGWVKQ